MNDCLALSVVAPCYNEQAVLPTFVERVTQVCEALNLPYEIVLVNDGSADDTWAIMNQLAQSCPALTLVNLSRNHGHQLALSAGLSIARGQRVLTIDADLQDPPELLGQMMQTMDDGADLVYAQRRQRPGDSMPKRIACNVFYRLLHKLTDVNVPLDTGDFRLLNRRIVDLLNQMPERRRFLRGMAAWIGFKQVPVHYDRDARAAGETKYPLFKLVRLAIDGVTSLSVKPLAIAGYLGVAGVGLAFVTLAYVVLSLILRPDQTPTGWASLTAIVTLFSSVQLIVLGVLGDYLGQIHEQIKGRPMFIIDQVIRRDESST